MKSAFDRTQLSNLWLLQDCRRWTKDKWITLEQYEQIRASYPTNLYHPNVIIRILLFLAGVVAITGAVGLLSLMFLDAVEHVWWVAAILLGILGIVVLESAFIKTHHHYKSGVNEAILYFSMLMLILGLGEIVDFNRYIVPALCVLTLGLAAYRYLDLISSAGALVSLAYFVFVLFNGLEGPMRFVIPFILTLLYLPMYFVFRSQRKAEASLPWHDCLLVGETVSLMIIYLAGNYLVVRELSQSMMGLYLEPGEDIPFWFLFMGLTVLVPVLYLFVGIRSKSLVLIRVGLLASGFSVFTFKYYFSLGHPEITLTLAGLVLIVLALWIFRYLGVPRNGYVKDQLISDKWSDAQTEAFAISQTLGGNKAAGSESFKYGGGSFGGGGSGGNY